jgi:hypothetical protein
MFTETFPNHSNKRHGKQESLGFPPSQENPEPIHLLPPEPAQNKASTNKMADIWQNLLSPTPTALPLRAKHYRPTSSATQGAFIPATMGPQMSRRPTPR